MGLAEIVRIDYRTVILWSAIQKTHKTRERCGAPGFVFYQSKILKNFASGSTTSEKSLMA